MKFHYGISCSFTQLSFSSLYRGEGLIRMPMIEVSPGELIDRYTVLRIKLSKIEDTDKTIKVGRVMLITRAAMDEYNESRFWTANESIAMNALQEELQAVNEEIWDRQEEFRSGMGPDRRAPAEAAQRLNDKRYNLKREIDKLCGSSLIEVKSYLEDRVVVTP